MNLSLLRRTSRNLAADGSCGSFLFTIISEPEVLDLTISELRGRSFDTQLEVPSVISAVHAVKFVSTFDSQPVEFLTTGEVIKGSCNLFFEFLIQIFHYSILFFRNLSLFIDCGEIGRRHSELNLEALVWESRRSGISGVCIEA